MDIAQKILLSVGLSTEDFDKKLLASQDKLAGIIKKKKELNDALAEKLKTGEIVEGTKAFNDMRTAINQTTAEQKLATGAIRELEKQQQNLLKINTETSGSNQQMKASLSLLTAEYNKLGEQERTTTEKGKTLSTSILDLTNNLIKNETAVGNNFRKVGDYTSIVTPLVEALKKENVILGQNNEELYKQRNNIADILKPTKEQVNKINEINAQLEINNKLYAANDERIKQVTHNIQDLTNKEKSFGETTEVAANSLPGMKKKLEELNATLNDPTLDVGSKKFKDASAEAKKLELKINQTLGKVNEFGDKEPKNPTKKAFSDTAEAGAGLVSIISLANVALGENGKTNEIQAATLKAVAVSQLAMNAAKGVGAILDVKDLVISGLKIAKEKIWGMLIDENTKKLKLSKAAVAATGWGALLLIMAELIFNFDRVNKMIQKGINYIRDLSSNISNGNKFVKAFVEVLLLVLSPMITIIRLIADFKGTITEFQMSINGALDTLINFADRIPLVGTALKGLKQAFNFVSDGLKSLAGNQKKFKNDIESLTKFMASYNDELERNVKQIDNQIRLAKAQGKSASDLAELEKKKLKEVAIAKQKQFELATEIYNKTIQQNGKLNEQETKMWNDVIDQNTTAQLDIAVFDEEQRMEQRNKWKEQAAARKDVLKELLATEMDFRIRTRQLEIEAFADENTREKEQLKFAFLQEVAAIDETLKNLKGSEKDKLKAKEQAALLKLELEKKLNFQLSEVDRKSNDEQRIKEQAAFDNSFEGKMKALTDQFNLDKEFADASIKNTEKAEEEKLKIRLKFLQDQLALTKQWAAEDGFLTEDEIDNIKSISAVLDDVAAKVAAQQNQPKMIQGLGLSEQDLSNINFAAAQIEQILTTIQNVVNATAQNRIRSLDDSFQFEKAGIENSTASQEEKEEKIKELTKRTAENKYKVELEQFEISKGIQIAQATMQGVTAALAAYASAAATPIIGSVLAPIAAAVAGAFALANVGIIASTPPPPKPTFFEGGFTEPGNPYNKSKHSNSYRDLHYDEYVAPSKVKNNPAAWPHIMALEGLRMNTPGRLNIGGFADGGFVQRQMAGDALRDIDFQTAISNGVAASLKHLNIYTKTQEVNRSLGELQGQAVATRMV